MARINCSIISFRGVLLLSLLPVSTLLGKPLSMQPDRELVSCGWAAEVWVKSVLRNRITVRITNDAAGVFRGYSMMDRMIKVTPTPYGPNGCLLDMRKLATKGERVLMVVRPTGQIAFIGQPIVKDGVRVYRLRTWCDYNAWWMFSKDKSFGLSVAKKTPDETMGGFEVSRRQVAGLFKTERAVFYQRTLQYLLSAQTVVDKQVVAELVDQLASPSFAVREHAERSLVKRGIASMPILQERYLNSKDIEIRFRLKSIISKMSEDLLTRRYVESLRKKGGEKGEAGFLLDAYEAVTSATRKQCVARLRQLARSSRPPLPLGSELNDAQVLKAWRSHLGK